MTRLLPFLLALLVAKLESQESVDSAATQVKRVQAMIEVVSFPPGASVYLDTRMVGVTPMKMEDVPYGKHVIRLQLEDHATFIDTLHLRFGTPHRLAPRLARFGTLVVRTTPPGIKVFVADTLAGYSPLTLGPARPGLTVVRIVDPVFLTVSHTVHIPEGDTALVNAQLVQAYSSLTLETDNSGAIVLVDGKTVGTGSLEMVQVPSGMRSLEVTDPSSGQSVSSILYMKPGGEVKAEVPFKKTQWKPILASVILPGTGQFMDGSWTSGAVYGGGFLIASAWTLTRADIYQTRLDSYEKTRKLYLAETDSEGEMTQLRHSAQQQLADAKNARSWLLGSIATVAVIYGLNIYNILTEHSEGPTLILTLDEESLARVVPGKLGSLSMRWEVRW